MIFSFCTTCMNRLEHIQLTIPTNMKLIRDFNNKYKKKHKFELSLCNYDSKDNLDEYILNNFKDDIDNNIFIYTKVLGKKIFNPGHAKNIAHKKSTGDVLINLDADNYLTKEFLHKIIELFENNINTITLGYIDNDNSGGYGRICISRKNFYILGGYYEKFIGYGTQDYDLVARSKKYLNLNFVEISKEYLNYINHDNLSRVINYDIKLYNMSNVKDFNNIYTIEDLDLGYNMIISKKYLDMNIVNINEYEKIIFGEI